MIFSPCSGNIIFVKKSDYESIVRIFISPFHKHDIFSPLTGKVVSIKKIDGKKYPAFFPIAARKNKRIVFCLHNEILNICMTVFAGMTTYKLNTPINHNHNIRKGELIAIIKFGSMVEIRGRLTFNDRVALFNRISAGDSIGCPSEAI
jgi:phosphatidylserine decarboxylase precursor-related protein